MTLLIENIRLACSSLSANKSRALLTMLGIIIGITSVIAIMTVGNSLTLSVSSSMQSMGANNITISVKRKETEKDEQESGVVFGTIENKVEITEEDYITDEMIYGLLSDFDDLIEAVSVSESLETVSVKQGSEEAQITITGTSKGYYTANELTLLAGNHFTIDEMSQGRNVALVSNVFVDELYDQSYSEIIGESFEADLYGKKETYIIVGIYEYVDSGMGFASSSATTTSCYIPLTTAQRTNHSKNYQSISVVSKIGVDSDELANKIENYLKGYYRSNQHFTVSASSMSAMLSTMEEMMSTITLAISVIAGIALLVGGIGVMNIMLVSITERTREIGTRKALGAPNGSIRLQFIVEAMVICLIGGFIGVLMGIGLGITLSSVLGFPASPSVSSIIASLLFSLGIGVFFGYYPANKAAKMNPIDALRYE
ncbi:ABC transporter permease [Lachnospiraceae bacterium OttesenSCG-928-D06]|nr:ABC transporter permease [Lachnospiraceae bacterium OttesenSCG-928-D06]